LRGEPRVRSKSGEEVRLETYDEFQDLRLFNQAVFTEGIKRASLRDYEKGVSQIANSFGFKKSSISKRWIKATAKKLDELQMRSLKEMDRLEPLPAVARHILPELGEENAALSRASCAAWPLDIASLTNEQTRTD